MLSSLIRQKNCAPEPAAAAMPSVAWREVMCHGIERVDSNQTCFEGGIGWRPNISDRSAGQISWKKKERAMPEFELYDGPNFCWEMPCNVVLRKRKICESCGKDCVCGRESSFFIFR